MRLIDADALIKDLNNWDSHERGIYFDSIELSYIIDAVDELPTAYDVDKADPETGLKPCPFCGGKAELVDHHLRLFAVRCPNKLDGLCRVYLQTSVYTTKEKAIAAWNRRVGE